MEKPYSRTGRKIVGFQAIYNVIHEWPTSWFYRGLKCKGKRQGKNHLTPYALG